MRCCGLFFGMVVWSVLLLARTALADGNKNPYIAGLLAEVFPGAGYLYQGDLKSGLLSSTLLIPMAAQNYVTTPTFATKSAKANLGTLSRNLFGYTVYDSFQSALSEDERTKQILPIPHYSFSDLYFAPFRTETYSSWKTWLPIGLGALSLGLNLQRRGLSPDLTAVRALVAIPIILAQSMIIGMGEESEFRGYQHPAFSQLTGSPLYGNFLQSFSFGLCHTKWGVCASPYLTGNLMRATRTIDFNTEYVAPSSPSDGGDISDLQYLASTAVMGLFFGWVVESEKDGLLKTITGHALYDALLVTSDMLTTNGTGRLYLSYSVPTPFW